MEDSHKIRYILFEKLPFIATLAKRYSMIISIDNPYTGGPFSSPDDGDGNLLSFVGVERSDFAKLGVFYYTDIEVTDKDSTSEDALKIEELYIATLYQNPSDRSVRIEISDEALSFVATKNVPKIRQIFRKYIVDCLIEGRDKNWDFLTSANAGTGSHGLVDIPEFMDPRVSKVNPNQKFTLQSRDAFCVTVETVSDHWLHFSFRPSELDSE